MSSALPVALSRLVALAKLALPALADRVFDGPPPGTETNVDMVGIGWQPEAVESAQSVQSWAALGTKRREETFGIVCSIAARDSAGSMTDARDRAFDYLAAIEAALVADITLGGCVRESEISANDLLQTRRGQMAEVWLIFTVSCKTRITPSRP